MKVDRGTLPCPDCGSDRVGRVVLPDYRTPSTPEYRCWGCWRPEPEVREGALESRVDVV